MYPIRDLQFFNAGDDSNNEYTLVFTIPKEAENRLNANIADILIAHMEMKIKEYFNEKNN